MSIIAGVSARQSAAATESSQSTASARSDVSFSDLLAEALQSELTEKAVTIAGSSGNASGGASGYDSTAASFQSGSSSIQQMILTAAASGEVGDAEIALFMLSTMMQSMEGTEFAPLMSAMASMLSQLQDGTSSTVRSTYLNTSGISSGVKQAVDEAVFYTGAVAADGEAVLPAQAWVPATPAIVGGSANRSAENLREIIDQFQVETAERYRPHKNGGDTYCNIYVWDVTAALGCEIPHYIDADTGAPRAYPDVSGATELGATASLSWLETYGPAYGWKEVTAEQAQAHANSGGPAVAAGSGHIQMVCPSENGSYDSIRGVTVAQAGGKNFNYAYQSSTFNSAQRSTVRYFIHA